LQNITSSLSIYNTFLKIYKPMRSRKQIAERGAGHDGAGL
jgi:hypothetical protein